MSRRRARSGRASRLGSSGLPRVRFRAWTEIDNVDKSKTAMREISVSRGKAKIGLVWLPDDPADGAGIFIGGDDTQSQSRVVLRRLRDNIYALLADPRLPKVWR